jgi:hypothetical protein
MTEYYHPQMKPERKDKRVTISLAKVVWDWANEMMEAKGFNKNVSAYVADLIRRDRDRELERTGTVFPPPKPSRLELNEPKPKKGQL